MIKKSILQYAQYLVCMLLLTWMGGYQSYAQAIEPEDLAGFYPLAVEEVSPSVSYARFIVADPWDVSIHGNHGILESDSDLDPTDSDYPFQSASFLDSGYVYCMDKTSTEGWIELREDPFEDHDLSDGYAVAFWLNNDGSLEGNVMETSYFYIEVFNDRDVLRIQATAHDTFYEVNLTAGWAMYCISFDPDEGVIDLYAIPVDYTTYTKEIFAGGAFEMDEEESNYLLTDFKGEIANIRFIKRFVEQDDVLDLYDLDYYWAFNVYFWSHYINYGSFSYYPLLKSSTSASDLAFEAQQGRDGTAVENVSYISPDESGSVPSFSESGAYMSLPHFFRVDDDDDYDFSEGVTISCWIYVGESYNTPLEGVEPVFTDDDVHRQLFYGTDADGQVLFGMTQVADRIGTNTYVDSGDGTRFPWYNWFYDPVSFRKKTGWFHIVYVQHEYWERVYVAKATESINCDCDADDWDCWRDCQMHYDYYSFQSLDDVVSWGLGNPSGYGVEALYQFRVYRWPLSVHEVTALHALESSTAEDFVFDGYLRKAATEETDATEETETYEESETTLALSVYPNPVSGTLNVSIYEPEAQQANLVLVNMMGVAQMRTVQPLEDGRASFTLSVDQYASGMYLLFVQAGNARNTEKILIK